MSITLELDPAVEQDLLSEARKRGLEVGEYVTELLKRETSALRSSNLSDLLLSSPFAGADLDLTRSQEPPRRFELE